MRKRLLAVGVIGLAPLCAFAIDGITLVNQSTVMAAGGFPYVISQPGSYKLSGNLVVANALTNAIVIAANNVTIDLNGFAIVGPLDCTTGNCSGNVPNSGYGIVAGSDSPAQSFFNITIRNGTIQGMGSDGVHLIGDSFLLEDLHVRSNGGTGLDFRATGFSAQFSAVVRHNTIQFSGTYGIKGDGGVVTENSVSQCGSIGIRLDNPGGTVSHNVVMNNVSQGLALGIASYFGNTLFGNNAGGGQVSGGTNAGQNVCGAVLCP